MKPILNCVTDKDFEELSEVLGKLRHCDVIVSLKQLFQRNDEDVLVDIQKHIIQNAGAMLMTNDKWVYLTLQGVSNMNSKKVYSMYNTYLRNGTNKNKQGNPNDYAMFIDLIRNDEVEGEADSDVYAFSLINPLFASFDERNNLTMVFEIESAFFEKSVVSNVEIDYELTMMDEEQDFDLYNAFEEDEENDTEDDSYTGSEYLDNNKYTEE